MGEKPAMLGSRPPRMNSAEMAVTSIKVTQAYPKARCSLGLCVAPLRAHSATGPRATAPSAAVMWMAMIGVSCMAFSLGGTVPPWVRPGHWHGTKRRKSGVKCCEAGMTAVTEAEPLPTISGMNKSSWKLWVMGAAALAVVTARGCLVVDARSNCRSGVPHGAHRAWAAAGDIAASGTVTPVTQVQVSSQVSGQIKELFADFNQRSNRAS